MLTCATARDWTDSLSKVVRHSAVEAAVGQNLTRSGTLSQFTEQWGGSCCQTSCTLRMLLFLMYDAAVFAVMLTDADVEEQPVPRRRLVVSDLASCIADRRLLRQFQAPATPQCRGKSCCRRQHGREHQYRQTVSRHSCQRDSIGGQRRHDDQPVQPDYARQDADPHSRRSRRSGRSERVRPTQFDTHVHRVRLVSDVRLQRHKQLHYVHFGGADCGCQQPVHRSPVTYWYTHTSFIILFARGQHVGTHDTNWMAPNGEPSIDITYLRRKRVHCRKMFYDLELRTHDFENVTDAMGSPGIE